MKYIVLPLLISAPALELYPNPFTTSVSIQIGSMTEEGSIRIIDNRPDS